MRSICVLFAALLSTTLSFASPVTYTYVGNNYDTIVDAAIPSGATFNTSQHVTGSLTFSGPLGNMAFGQVTPVAFSFSSGAHTFTQADALDYTKIFLEIVGGVITSWDIQFNDHFLYVGDPLGKQENDVFTRKTASNTVDGAELLQMTSATGYRVDTALVKGSPGVWSTDAVAVPEPGSLALVSLALFAALVARRTRSAR